jgi:hypothetical protein
MLSLTEKIVRDSFVNASRKEVSDLTLPAGFTELDWTKLDYLGWRDPKLPRRAYLHIPSVDGPEAGVVGVLLRRADAVPRQRAQCSWCQDVTLPNPVVFYSAKRAGDAGRKGDTIGTLICEDFQCSANVRKLPPMAYLGFDAEAARLDRIAALQLHAAGFADAVVNGT